MTGSWMFFCFAACYCAALVLEITRLWFRSGVRGALLVGAAAAGLVLHTLYLYQQALGAATSPLSSTRDWCLVAAWVLAGTYLYLAYTRATTPFGLFLLPLVLVLIGAGMVWGNPQPYPREPASKVWGTVHAVSILLATVSMLVGFAAGLMYLRQAHLLKQKVPPTSRLQLPSLEWLRWAAGRALGIAMLMLGVGIFSGMVLNIFRARQHAVSLPWTDPVVLSTLTMFGWLIVCTGVGTVYRPAREGRYMAFLTVVSVVFLLAALAMVLFAYTEHGGLHGSSYRPRAAQMLQYADRRLGGGPASSKATPSSSAATTEIDGSLRMMRRSPAPGETGPLWQCYLHQVEHCA